MSDESVKKQLAQLEKTIFNVEAETTEIKKAMEELNQKLSKHIDFIDNTYEGLKNPIDVARKFFKGRQNENSIHR